MTLRRVIGVGGGTAVPLVVLILLFGNQWLYDALLRNDVGYSGTGGQFLRWLEFPVWRLTAGSTRHRAFLYVVSLDFTVLLLLVLAVGLAVLAARALDERRGLFGAVVAAWWATIVAAGVAGLVRGLLLAWVLEYPGSMRSMSVWQGFAQGLGFGFWFGWLAGIGALVGFLLARPRVATPAGAPGTGPIPVVPPRPGTGPMPIVPQHPSAVPYAPPPGAQYAPGPQQPPQPQQPPPGWSGAPSVPPAQPPVQQPPAAPAPPADAPADAGDKREEAAEEAREDEHAEPKDEREDGPKDEREDDGGLAPPK
ncbi:hypothetical protein [Actinomadura parmotrematis]|uniref:DUF5671 domain-containing protein n=1 Tax=Actinomadura parmotrematis TaxID=2864039 RepID=A0ABS7FUU7_9ACTN|nr:hypothetical protein [Actinomadura parmotrematis]MBW8484173.1 hypothetical protein [Actinomadura parmotrematis]